MINVTKPFLPPIEKYESYLKGIWERNWLTNHGPLVNELELKLKEYFNVPYFFYVNNGTIALQIAIKALEKTGEIITTPFTYVATTSTIVWENCTPVFVDIDRNTLTIDVTKIEAAITPKTIAILPTHVYGIPCEVEKIEQIAAKHNLKVIYDGAHSFGTKYKGTSIYNHGDISTLSFHSTKLFHTVEGGAIITKNAELAHKISYLRNFGHDGPEKFFAVGINGKNSEFHAAMGLCNFHYIEEILQRRKELFAYYSEKLKTVRHIRIPNIDKNCVHNHAYYPIIFENAEILERVVVFLNRQYIYPRRYFYPSLNTLNYVTPVNMPVSETI